MLDTSIRAVYVSGVMRMETKTTNGANAMTGGATMTTKDAVQRVDPWWRSRAIEMIDAVVVAASGFRSTISSVRVAAGWPGRGSITFVRDEDGQRFRAYLGKGKNGKFRTVAVLAATGAGR